LDVAQRTTFVSSRIYGSAGGNGHALVEGIIRYYLMAMLAVPVSPDISRLFREIEVDAYRDPSDHITLFFFGDYLEIGRVLKIIPVVFDITSNMKPFEVTTTKITTFPKGDKGYPVIAEIKSPQLEDLRNNIKKAFESKNIKFDERFQDFKLHITLGYSKKKPKSIRFDKFKWIISQIGLYAGDNADSRLFVNFPFTLGVSKTAKLTEFTNTFVQEIRKV